MTRLGERSDWLACYVASTLVVILGVVLGRECVKPTNVQDTSSEPFIHSFVHWDGWFYRDIASRGYSYTPGRMSTVHFFPLYPLLSRIPMIVGRLPVQLALVLTSNLCLLLALYLFGRYTDLRYGEGGAGVRTAVLLAVCFVPVGMFFRMAYTESLCLLLCVAFLYLLERQANPVILAAVVALATVTRAVGVALVPPLLVYLAHTAKNGRSLVGRTCLCLPLALGGLLAFVIYCGWAFGDPWAFARNRMALWAVRPVVPLEEKLLTLAALEPVWGFFTPESPASWRGPTIPGHLAFNLPLANSAYFAAALVLLVLGRWKGWLNGYETLTALGLLLVPYWMTAYETRMLGMARYVVVVAPLYLVLGQLLAKLSPVVGGGVVGLSSFLLGAYAALFAQWYFFL
jgi:Mannosyltransferase (PIG-V)